MHAKALQVSSSQSKQASSASCAENLLCHGPRRLSSVSFYTSFLGIVRILFPPKIVGSIKTELKVFVETKQGTRSPSQRDTLLHINFHGISPRFLLLNFLLSQDYLKKAHLECKIDTRICMYASEMLLSRKSSALAQTIICSPHAKEANGNSLYQRSARPTSRVKTTSSTHSSKSDPRT